MTSHGTRNFWQIYAQLPREIRQAARLTYRKFREEPAHPGLHLERLRSDPSACSVRVTLKCRAVARRQGDDWLGVWIGDHQEFDRRFPG